MRKSKINRVYKDRLFRMAFRGKKDLLELYNAINGSHYTNLDDLIITTLDDAVYLGVKNDVSFLLDHVLTLWEHQSSYNPNMPIRGLSYFAKLYQQYIEKNNLNIYGKKLQKLPFPQYIVFYNGKDEAPERQELRLSDAYIRPEGMAEDRLPDLELRAVMLNINWGKNQELMEACGWLGEYARFVAKVREYQNVYSDVVEAVNHAVDEAIKEGILEDILSRQKAEVIELFLTEYDEEKQRRLDREDAKQEAKEELREEVKAEVRKELQEKVRAEVREEMREEVQQQLKQELEQEMLGQVNELNRLLIENGRIDDVLKAANDVEYQKKLLKELLK